jgi:hypothetical protein
VERVLFVIVGFLLLAVGHRLARVLSRRQARKQDAIAAQELGEEPPSSYSAR